MSAARPAPAIDFVSDVVCPWCFIGLTRLEQALDKSGVPRSAVDFHPFQLDPTTPREGVDLRERLKSKYGADPEKMFASVVAAAKDAGIDLDFSKVRRMPNTLKAHALVTATKAAGLGPEVPAALVRSLFEAYFLEGKDVGDDDVLVAIGRKHGLDESRVRAVLADDKVLSETQKEARELAQQGIGGVPFVVVDNKFAVSGAQPTAVFVQAIERARAAPAAASAD